VINEYRIIPVILSGGMGRRLRPLSSFSKPKAFLKLIGDRYSFLEKTLKRVDRYGAPVILINKNHLKNLFLIKGSNLSKARIIAEPSSLNTGPAIGIAATIFKDEKNVLLLLPIDHEITKEEQFHKLINVGLSHAYKGELVTFGVPATYAETGYGYIECGKSISDGVSFIEKFHEKPDIETAKIYCRNNHYLWNAGIFMVRADVLFNEFPLDMQKLFLESLPKDVGDNVVHLNEMSWNRIESSSFDKLIMEKCSKAVVVHADMGWCDLGTWKNFLNASSFTFKRMFERVKFRV
jgi:mannose-1-phosphate guanylyltransferase